MACSRRRRRWRYDTSDRGRVITECISRISVVVICIGNDKRLMKPKPVITVSITTVGMAFGNHSGWGGNHFGHRAFGHPFHNRFRFHKTLIVPYAYYDYGYPTDAFGDYPPPVAGVVAPPSPPPTAYHRNVERFNPLRRRRHSANHD